MLAKKTVDFLKKLENNNDRDWFTANKGLFLVANDNRLMRPPKGFAADDPAIEYLKLKSFTVSQEFTEKEALGKNYTARLAKSFEDAYPLIEFLRNALKI